MNTIETQPLAAQSKPVSDARVLANRLNAKRSTGPKTPEGKKRSSLNATRHGLLAQTLHLPEEEMTSYDKFTESFVKDLSPVGVVETQLAHSCADLQFRLHRIAAAEHNLFSIGHVENGDLWSVQVTDPATRIEEEHTGISRGASESCGRCAQSSRSPGHPEAHTALAFAETIRNSPEPLKTLSLYEQRLSRRFQQTLKQLREIQSERREREQEDLQKLASLAIRYTVEGVSKQDIENIDPIDLGFVCSKRSWDLYCRRDHHPRTFKSAA